MTNNPTRLRSLFVFNILGAGVPGALIIFFPDWASGAMFSAPQDAAMLGMLGSIWLAIGAVSGLGLRFPQTFKSIFALQLTYKSVWLFLVAGPLLAKPLSTQAQTADITLYASFFLVVITVFSVGLFADSSKRGSRAFAEVSK